MSQGDKPARPTRRQFVATLESLSRYEAIEVLKAVTLRDAAVTRRVLDAIAGFSPEDPLDVAEEVRMDIEALGAQDLWSNAGDNGYGYVSPEEAAWEMLEGVLKEHFRVIERYRRRRDEANAFARFLGILKGIYDFGMWSDTEFRTQLADDPRDFFGSALSDWLRERKLDSVPSELADFVEEHCPEWASDLGPRSS